MTEEERCDVAAGAVLDQNEDVLKRLAKLAIFSETKQVIVPTRVIIRMQCFSCRGEPAFNKRIVPFENCPFAQRDIGAYLKPMRAILERFRKEGVLPECLVHRLESQEVKGKPSPAGD